MAVGGHQAEQLQPARRVLRQHQAEVVVAMSDPGEATGHRAHRRQAWCPFPHRHPLRRRRDEREGGVAEVEPARQVEAERDPAAPATSPSDPVMSDDTQIRTRAPEAAQTTSGSSALATTSGTSARQVCQVVARAETS